jgi:AraC-like DNA-binding protein
MEQRFLFLNTALVIECFVMSIIFLTLPLPSNKSLARYRVSLRFLAGAYLILAILTLIVMIFDVNYVNLISVEGLTISTLQAPLFSYALITLINPYFICKRYLFTQLLPVAIMVGISALSAYKWGNPILSGFEDLRLFALHPTVMVRWLFFSYYVFQLVSLTRLFLREIDAYKGKIDNYFTDNKKLYFSVVRYSFYAVLSVGFGALLLNLIPTELYMFIFTIYYSIFYLFFGVYYIQYPRIFTVLEPVISSQTPVVEEFPTIQQRFEWGELKNEIIVEKYYLRHNVTILEMALYLKIGRTTLSKFVNGEEGMNFNKWINTLRAEDAKRILLEYPDCTIIQIAEMLGYADASSFIRRFKQIVGETPSIWRKTNS